MSAKRISLLTHNLPSVTAEAVQALVRIAKEREIELVAPPGELEGSDAGLLASIGNEEESGAVDVRICLGGDGTILRGLRQSTGTDVPVFGINFGEVGFLAACDPDGTNLDESFMLAIDGTFDSLQMPSLVVGLEGSPEAFNDVSLQRRPGLRIADIAYAVGSDEVGRVRCDGMVVSTPAGSTGYNLANGGPVMAWGVEGYTVSFIAPHSLTARALIVAPGDTVRMINQSPSEPVDIAIDGRPGGELPAGGEIEVRYRHASALLAQTAGSTFYHRLREKFGRLAT